MKEPKPLISVITITYNAAKELPATLKSIKQQSFSGFEHLIVDGASRDDTLAIARAQGLPDARIVSEPDNGLYYAMNKGLALARGKYILFLNAGDAFHSPETLAMYADAALKDPDIIYGDTIIVDEDRTPLRPRHLSVPAILTKESFRHGMLICHQAFMTKHSIAPKFDTAYRFSADYDWTIKCIKKSRPGNCINLNAVTIDYLDAGTTEQNKIKSLKERFRIMCHHYGTFPTIWSHISFIPRAIGRRLHR